jgi:hypothetical protein
VTKAARLEYLEQVRMRYAQVGRKGKGAILDELCQVTGYHRKYALRLLHRPAPGPRRSRHRALTYGPEVIRALAAIWQASGYPWSARLKALLPLWIPWARKRLRLSGTIERQLLAISARQMDRRLQDHKRDLRKRLYGRTKPGSLLKHHIPLRTDRWDVTRPGFTELDLVAHSGSKGEGDFIHSLNVTDIHSTWVETCAIMGKSQARTCEGLEQIRRRLPFDLLGIDSDNGSEFINDHLLSYCKQRNIQFTRGRPYKKDDNAHIEQKNWTHVRKLMGYVRYDTKEALDAMNRLYAGELRLLQNLFLPSVKLQSKERVGSRLRRRYEAPRTPLDRMAGCKGVNRFALHKLKLLRSRLDPFELSTAIDRQLSEIHGFGTQWSKSRPVRCAPDSPWRTSLKTLLTPPHMRVTF